MVHYRIPLPDWSGANAGHTLDTLSKPNLINTISALVTTHLTAIKTVKCFFS